jgi:hypothetical protein
VEGFHTKGWIKFFIVDFVYFHGQNNILTYSANISPNKKNSNPNGI